MSSTKFRKLACYLCNLTIWIGIIGFYLVNLLLWPVFTVADPGADPRGGGVTTLPEIPWKKFLPMENNRYLLTTSDKNDCNDKCGPNVKSKSFQTLLEIIYLASSLGSHIWSLFALIQKRNRPQKSSRN